MKNRYFYLYQNSTELNLIKVIINLLPLNDSEHFIFCVDTNRMNLKSISNLPVNEILIDDIIYTKNLKNELKKKNKLKNILKLLNVSEYDTFITQPIFSLNNFILYKFFKQKQSKIISWALNSVKIKSNKLINLDFLLSLRYSFYTLLFAQKLILFYNIKNTEHNFVFTKTRSNIHLDFGSSIRNELIFSDFNLKFAKLFEVNLDKPSNKILLLIRSHSSSLLFGISEETYLYRIKKIIKFLKSKSFSVVVKNHPSSIISKRLMAKKLGIDVNDIIDSNENLESYLLKKSNEFIHFLTEDSNVALTLDFFNLNYYTINELICKDSSYYSKVFGLDRLLDLNEMKIKPKKSSKFILKKQIFNDYINQINNLRS